MEKTKENYIRPEVYVIEVEQEGVLCGSPEQNIDDIIYDTNEWGSPWNE